MPTPCSFCPAGSTALVVEVWFDFGEDNMRFCSTAVMNEDPADASAPPQEIRVCEEHMRVSAHAIASDALLHAWQSGATGPLWPTRWWVAYRIDGVPGRRVIGGDVGPKPAAPVTA
jgi:hypothetical protein